LLFFFENDIYIKKIMKASTVIYKNQQGFYK